MSKAINDVTTDVKNILRQLYELLMILAGFVVALLIFDAVLKFVGFDIPFVRSPDTTQLAYLCGAYWLARKAG